MAAGRKVGMSREGTPDLSSYPGSRLQALDLGIDYSVWPPPSRHGENPLGGKNPYQRGLLKRKGVRASQTGPGPVGTLVTAGQTVGATIHAPTRGTQVVQHFHRAFRQGTIGRIRLAQGKARRDAQGRFL